MLKVVENSSVESLVQGSDGAGGIGDRALGLDDDRRSVVRLLQHDQVVEAGLDAADMRDHADEAAGQRQALDAVDGEIEARRIKGAEALVEEEAVQPASSLGHRLAECEGEGQRGEKGLAARQG